MKIRSLLLIALTLVLTAALTPRAEAQTTPVYFQASIAAKRFVLKISDRRTIQQARKILAQKRSALFVGRIVPTAASYNRGWSYHVEPRSIRFAQLSIELCDANPKYIEQNLSKVGGEILPGGIWCPWGAVLKREVR
jgi:hypothetical protein